jgi:hypothetical protein
MRIPHPNHHFLHQRAIADKTPVGVACFKPVQRKIFVNPYDLQRPAELFGRLGVCDRSRSPVCIFRHVSPVYLRVAPAGVAFT